MTESSRRPSRFALGVGALVLLAAVQGVILFQRMRDAQVEVQHFQPGESLPTLTLSPLGGLGEGKGEDVTTEQVLAPSACTMVIFFASTCPFVRKVAPQWKGVGHITRDGITVPVVWVATSPSDTGASHFAHAAQVQTPAYVFRSDVDARRFGASDTPAAYLVDRRGTLLDAAYPDSVVFPHLPGACRGTR